MERQRGSDWTGRIKDKGLRKRGLRQRPSGGTTKPKGPLRGSMETDIHTTVEASTHEGNLSGISICIVGQWDHTGSP